MTESRKIPVSEERLRALPRLPGVYLMRNEAGDVLYVGKAKNLRARVRSYFNLSDSRYKVRFIVDQVRSIDTIVTSDEREALILENDLIKRHHPRYNARLRDDKSHLIVRIDPNHPYPRLELVRRIERDGARYIGPFPFTHEIRTLLDVINRSIPLRTCTDKVMANRVRPCLEHQIKRCAAPCCFPVNRERYAEWLEQAIAILEGRSEEIIDELEEAMERASAELRFEDAAVIRDRLAVLKRSREESVSFSYGRAVQDVFGLYRQGGNAELVVLSVRNGRLFGSRTFGLSDVEVPERELLPALVSEFYNEVRDIPEEILLPAPIEDKQAREAMYSEELKRRVRILVPKRGRKLSLVRLAEENAKENFVARFGSSGRDDAALQALREALSLPELPRVIECIDVSHFQGGETVAAVVLFRDGRPARENYRLFRLSQEGKPDDFASMREVVRRHLSRSLEEDTLPDLIVIDGGPAQLTQALIERQRLGLRVPPMVALAKRRVLRAPYKMLPSAVRHKPERIYIEDSSVPVVLKATDSALQLLEQLRDEAHRFAISYHRRRRHKRLFTSELHRIPGIGEKRRNRLLREFGSVEALRRAAPEEVATRCEIPLPLATRVVELLRQWRSEKQGG